MEKEIMELERALSILATEINRISFMLKEVKDGIASRNLGNYREHPAKGTVVKPGASTSSGGKVADIRTLRVVSPEAHD